jgi:hypothetical protein
MWPFRSALSYERLTWQAPAGTDARRRYAAEAVTWWEDARPARNRPSRLKVLWRVFREFRQIARDLHDRRRNR